MKNRTTLAVVLAAIGLMCVCCAAIVAGWIFGIQPQIEAVMVPLGSGSRCAYAFEDLDGDGYFDPSSDRYLRDISGATVELTDSSGRVISRSGLRECSVSGQPFSTTFVVRLALSEGYVATSPLEQEIFYSDPYLPAAFGVQRAP